MRILNLGILAHVDAGKTTLTERLLFAAGVIDEIGSVDDGNTQTDTLLLERQRGITIKSAVVSFVVDDVTINLIDTPGHPDFIAEVERVLNVLDGAVLVISAVEGVQAQTRVLMRTLQRLHIPTILFVNKTDRRGADVERVLGEISDKLTTAIVPMYAGLPRFAEALADHDDEVFGAYADGRELGHDAMRAKLAAHTGRARVHPVFCGSAITGAGVDVLTAGVTGLLPAHEGDAHGETSASVFKVERGPAGEKVAYVRMFTGTLHTRERVRFGDAEAKVTAINAFQDGTAVQRPSVAAGQIAKLWGLSDVRIGDTIGAPRANHAQHFAPPALETVVVPARPADKAALHSALSELAEQDPLINLRQDDVRRELFVSLYGEVQKEVIQATLANEYGIDVGFRETTTVCVERPAGTGEAMELIRKNPFLATVGLRVEPGSGFEFHTDIDAATVPLYVYKTGDAFRTHVESVVRQWLGQGLYGWQVADCRVTLTASGYLSPGTGSSDFKYLTPLVLMSALKRAGTVVCEPINAFELDVPADALSGVLRVLARLDAVPQPPEMRGATCTVLGHIPAGRVHELQLQLRGLTHGEGVLESVFDRYEPVRGTPPRRPVPPHHPLNRKQYLMHVLRRVP